MPAEIFAVFYTSLLFFFGLLKSACGIFLKKEAGMHSKKKTGEKAGLIILILGCIFWGLSGTCGQYLFTYKNISSGWLVMVRTLTSGILLSLLCLIRKDKNYLKIWTNKKDVLRLFIFSFCGLLLSQYSYLTAIYYTNAGTATIIQQVSPVLLIFVLCIRQKRLPKLREVICVLLALLGTFLIATKGNPSSLALSGWGIFWGLMSAVGVVTYSLTSQHLAVKYGSIPVTAQGMLIAGIGYTLISRQYKTQVSFDAQMILPLMGVVVLGTVFAYTMYVIGVEKCGPLKANLLGTLEPVSAVVFSFLWLKTEVTVYDIIGGILILSLVIIQSMPSGSEGHAKEKSA